MVRPDFAKWGQDAEAIRQLALTAEHPRTRERFLALYMIGTGRTNASQWAQEIDRQPATVIGWVHRYNAEGPASLFYRRTGGRRPLFAQKRRRKSSKL
ncbi:MAG: helix-turn-helix domain-containing protein [Deltaproteobacteria bacterium]|nr:MAG: helix-turn-helix domain-containing protein [Deltaproteobacteria bacterium]